MMMDTNGACGVDTALKISQVFARVKHPIKKTARQFSLKKRKVARFWPESGMQTDLF
jgi:hypothetical protein